MTELKTGLKGGHYIVICPPTVINTVIKADGGILKEEEVVKTAYIRICPDEQTLRNRLEKHFRKYADDDDKEKAAFFVQNASLEDLITVTSEWFGWIIAKSLPLSESFGGGQWESNVDFSLAYENDKTEKTPPQIH